MKKLTASTAPVIADAEVTGDAQRDRNQQLRRGDSTADGGAATSKPVFVMGAPLEIGSRVCAKRGSCAFNDTHELFDVAF